MWADPSLLSGPIFPLFLLKVPGTACHLLFHQYFISTLLCSLHRNPVVSSLASFTSLLRSHSHCVPSGSPLSLDDTSSSYSSQFSLAKMDSKTCKVSSNALSTCYMVDSSSFRFSFHETWHLVSLLLSLSDPDRFLLPNVPLRTLKASLWTYRFLLFHFLVDSFFSQISRW